MNKVIERMIFGDLSVFFLVWCFKRGLRDCEERDEPGITYSDEHPDGTAKKIPKS